MESIFANQSSTNFVSFDELQNAFKTPTQRQDYYEPDPKTSSTDGDLSRLADPDGTANQLVDAEPETVVDHEHAMRTGERIARLIDTGIDFTLSNFVARNGESYRADERDLKDIAEAWGEVSEEHQWNIGPEWTLAILYGVRPISETGRGRPPHGRNGRTHQNIGRKAKHTRQWKPYRNPYRPELEAQ